MSNNLVFASIGFVLGGIIGGLLAGCFLGKEYKKRVDAMQYEIDQLSEARTNEKKEELETREKIVNGKAKKLSFDLGYSSKEKSEEDDEEFDSEEDVNFDDPFVEEKDDSEKAIKIIDKKTFDEDLPYRDTEKLMFYQLDGILADEFDEAVPNSAELIGMEAIEEAENTENDMMYVDNEFTDILYEIEINHIESFYRDLAR